MHYRNGRMSLSLLVLLAVTACGGSSSSGTPDPVPTLSDSTPPTVPANLVASAVSASQINLSWDAATDNVGVTGYSLYQAGTLLASVTATSYTHSGLSPSTSYSYTVSAHDAAGNTSAQSGSVSAITPGGSGTASRMIFQNFDGATVPKNTGGDDYPAYYVGNNEGGVFAGSIDTTKKVAGTGSLKMQLTSGTGLYAQWNPYGPSGRTFARDYSANPSGWQFNTYNRMRLWFFDPSTGEPERYNGTTNYYMGTYVKAVTNADTSSDEAGGGHYYHPFNVVRGQWSLCTFNSHPGHERGDPGALDTGNRPYPTAAPWGAGDPAGTYNYFDTLTRWYLSGDSSVSTRDYWLDEIEFYREPNTENDEQIYSICASYTAATNRIFLTWNRPKDENAIDHEVRYAFSDIHVLGWSNATAAPDGVITPPGFQGYNGMLYDTTGVNINGNSTIYLAIKPQNSSAFSQLVLPLNAGVP